MSDARWQLVPLKEIAPEDKYAIVGGPFGSKLVSRDYVPDGVPVLRGANLPQDREIELDDLVFVTEEKVERDLFGNLAHPGDIVVTQRGTLGQIGLVPDPANSPYDRYVVSQSQMKLTVDPTKADNRFVFYALRSPGSVKRIQDLGMSSGVPHINLDIFRNFEIRLPDLITQRSVAAVLRRYDDLIENNRRRIEILEEMARLIYREWFVHFRFPGHSDVELVDSDLGPIPAGWDVSPLEDLQSAMPNATAAGPFGSKLGRKDYVDEPGVPVIRGANLRVGGGFVDEGFVFVSKEKADTLTSSLARPGDVVVTQRGTLGQVGLLPKLASFAAYVLSQSQMKFTADDDRVDPLVIYMQLATPEGTRRMQDIATGSGVPHINLSMFREMKFLVPARSIQRDFVAAVSPMERLRDCLDRQNRTLAGARDLLLPRLISGELDVSDLGLDLDSVA